MNLIIDIGNTLTKVACFRDNELVTTVRYSSFTTDIARAWFKKYQIKRCILASVKENQKKITGFLKDNASLFIQLNHRTPLPFKISYLTPETLGKDRIAAVAGAYNKYPDSNVLIVDMGTAITYDFINSNAEYLGGNISPGLIMRYKALNAYTDSLPLIDNDEIKAEFGNDTRTAIIAGVQQGIRYELNGYINYFLNHFDKINIIFTGGDSKFFVNNLKNPIFVIPNLVLEGLNYILEFNASTL
jgi:type III pantothenate kinase